MLEIGGTADWVLITRDAVWVASTKPYAVLRIDPATRVDEKSRKVIATIRVGIPSVGDEPTPKMRLAFWTADHPATG